MTSAIELAARAELAGDITVDDHGTPNGDWQDCPEGQISGMLQGIQRRRRNDVVRRVVVGSVIVLVAGFSPLLLSSNEPVASTETTAPEICGITCREVKQNARDWLSGKIADEMSGRIEAHLEECPHCPKFVENIQLENDQSAFALPARFLLAASQ